MNLTEAKNSTTLSPSASSTFYHSLPAFHHQTDHIIACHDVAYSDCMLERWWDEVGRRHRTDMIFKLSRSRTRSSLRWLIFIALAWTAFNLWSGGFFNEHYINQREFSLARLSPTGAVPGHFASRFCAQHGWKPFKPRVKDGRRKIYDLCMVNTELDWLEIRLNTTYDYVDHFVLVEASKTFTGKDKPLVIKGSMDRFIPYREKIIYHELQYPPGFDPKRNWDREDLQRDAMFTQVFPTLSGARAPAPGDVLVVADVDEIPRPETLVTLRTCDFPRRLTLRSRFYYYSFQFLHRGVEWAHPQATYYQGPSRTLLPVNLRNGDGAPQPWVWWEKGDLWNAAWHCSSCYETIEGFLRKLSSFSHAWMNQDEFRDRDRIADAVREGKDLWGREGEFFDRVENNTDVPAYLLKHPDRFRYLVNRDGKSAGFIDYP
jgi:beta-1,4-mannosyl-glycoprotein beta-1,4-N-acetylglucosaminyltransferase